ncbi:MAG TPA: Rne/Rng family ribonuclease [Candidatus Acidoferrum sp.]|nr:Rne/Rng family ribonuclease [Candidatus Acidoferrum sp.]
MSKELVISASSHERRVAILEEGQLVEIYIEREKEFALVGSIYKGKVTRVLPGMQSAFVDIGLDGDAFLYVSDVFENLEDYEPHEHHSQRAPAPEPSPAVSAGNGSTVELLPGESLARTSSRHEDRREDRPGESRSEEFHSRSSGNQEAASSEEASSHASEEGAQAEGQPAGEQLAAADSSHAESGEERQPESNASAPQNFSPRFNPTQNYSRRPGNDRGHDRGSDRGSDRGNERQGQHYGRGGDRGRGGRWGRRGGGGRHRGGRQQGGPGGRNLPPSKYASPQGGEFRGGYDNRDRGQQRYDNRRQEGPRSSGPSPVDASEEILLPGESLAKYREKPIATPSAAAPTLEQESRNDSAVGEETAPRPGNSLPVATSGSAGAPRRRSGGLPSWLLAEGATEAGPEAASETSPAETDSASSPAAQESEPTSNGADLDDDQVAALAADLAEAKHEEVAAGAEADAVVGGAVFEEEDDTEEETEVAEEAETPEGVHAETASGLSPEDVAEVEAHRAADRAEFAADVAHESAEHIVSLGEQAELQEEILEAEVETEAEVDHAESEEEERAPEPQPSEEPLEAEEVRSDAEVIAASIGEPIAAAPASEESEFLLPGETRSPRADRGPSGPREDYPRDSARIGGNPRSRFQRPFRGRDRGGDRGGRPDRRGGDRGRGRFERRGPGGRRHDHGHSAPRRPQLISEMLKPGEEIVIQIAKEPLGKKGARITSHVALPGRFLVYMPTVHHTGVSRKIISAENRSRLRRLVSEASANYPGGFIVRTAAGGATDDEIRADIDFLGKTWLEIKQRSEERKAPSLLHRDLDLVERMLRDYVSDDFTAIWIDNEEEYGKVVDFVNRFQPKLVSKVKLYTKETPIFEEFGIQHELDKALRAKVWLKSGGYIVINHTEALVAIDVNTGKFVGKGSTRLEDTIVKTNLEAVKEIVRQIRLRDLGGIIVVDFIDMEERRNRERVLSALQQALEQDKAPSKALSFNEFGLVCITRKRTKQALERVLCQPCPYCTGSGMVKSTPTLCYEIQAEARKMAAADPESPSLTLRVHPEIAKALKTRESMLIDELEQNSHKHVIIQSDATLHWEQYDIY